MDSDFSVIALISAYNEGDIISQVIGHLAADGVATYLIDHHSTDDTIERARKWEGRGLIGLETFPDAAGRPEGDRDVLKWENILRRKEQLSQELDADWFIHHDADEIRRSPFPGMNLRDALRWIDGSGYNCVDFELYNFWPTDNAWIPGESDPDRVFSFYEPAAVFDRVQRKCWKKQPAGVDLAGSGGHNVRFPGRVIFPIPFILQHYRIRSQTHGERKVFAERVPRFDPAEKQRGWHVQYEEFARARSFVRDPKELKHFDLGRERLRLLTRRGPANLDGTYSVLENAQEDPFRPLFILGAPAAPRHVVAVGLKRLGLPGYAEGYLAPLLGDLVEAVDAHYRMHENLLGNRKYLIARVPPREVTYRLGATFEAIYRDQHENGTFFERTGNRRMILVAPRIARIWPQAKFILVRRDGRNTIAELARRFPETPFERHCRSWAECMQAWLDVRDSLTTHLELDLKDLLNDPTGCALKIGTLLSLPKTQADALKTHLTAAAEEERRRLAGIGADTCVWSEDQEAKFQSICGTLMKRFGYESLIQGNE